MTWIAALPPIHFLLTGSWDLFGPFLRVLIFGAVGMLIVLAIDTWRAHRARKENPFR